MIPQWVIALHQVAHGFPGGIPALAKRLGTHAGVLQNKVDPGQEHECKIGEFMAILAACGDFSPFILLGREYGFLCIPSTPAETTEGLLQTLARLQAELGDVAREGLRALEDGHISINERKRLVKEFRDLLDAVNQGLAALDTEGANESVPRNSA